MTSQPPRAEPPKVVLIDDRPSVHHAHTRHRDGGADRCRTPRLKKTAYGHKAPHQSRQRATIVLLAAGGRANAKIAADTRLHVDTVRTWRGRFAQGGIAVLTDRRRSGRPARFTPVQVTETKQSTGLPTPGRERAAAVTLVRPGTARRADSARDHRQHLGLHRAPRRWPGGGLVALKALYTEVPARAATCPTDRNFTSSEAS
ncbi:helix-turn-helix domain-containing protein [Streptomyces sp. NPDC006660]|uniref:helix-turn-helix domain-containing protein n=1 Tax=Streptomyces sp. NPDC006660 TaxID=3156901 RepID=UPI0033D9827B